MAAIRERSFNLADGGEPERLSGARVSASLLPLLGLQPQLGRTFLAEEDAPGRDAVVLISHHLWTRRFGAASRPFHLTVDKSHGYAPVDRQGDSMGKPVDLVQGTLDLLILKAVRPAPLHGWAIAQRINLLSRDVLRVQQGSLYPALQRLEREGWIAAEWGASENNRRARFYTLTKAGRRHLEREQAGWERLSDAITLVLRSS